MKNKLYISQEYFKKSPEKSGFAMMKDGEIFFYQIEQQEGEELKQDWHDLREVAHIQTQDVLLYQRVMSLSGVTISNEELFTQLVARYDTAKPIIHKTSLKGN